jgi:three-Cys-motif partner protein
MEHESKTTMYEHSAAKVRLLKEYIAAYLGILSNADWIKDVYIYDLFCGPGIYENDGVGSPIVFLNEIIKAHHTVANPRNKPTNFRCLFNDLDSEKINQLRLNIEKLHLDLSRFGHIDFQSKDYKLILEDIKQEIKKFKNERGFVFIDPYGYSEVALSDIEAITSIGKTEVLLFMPTHHMYRFKENATPECLVNFLEDLGLTQKIKGVDGLDFIELVKSGFQNKLGNGVYVDSFVLKRDLNQFFCLFFFTSNFLGFIKMLEAKWKIDKEDGRGWGGVEVGTLFANLAETANTDKLKKLLLKFLKDEPRTCGEVFEFIILNRFLPKHGTEILKSIQTSLDVISNDGTKVPKGAFYLTYDTFKSDPKKITIRLK